MDKRKIIKEKFYQIFCEINEGQRRHAEVWLTVVKCSKNFIIDEFYELKVKMLPDVKRSHDEITEIIEILDHKAKEEFKPVCLVKIIEADENKHCKRKDIMVYCERIFLCPLLNGCCQNIL